MKAWFTRDTQDKGGLYSAFIGSPPIHDPEDKSGCGMWIAAEAGFCLAADSDPDAFEQLGVQLEPGECREVEITVSVPLRLVAA